MAPCNLYQESNCYMHGTALYWLTSFFSASQTSLAKVLASLRTLQKSNNMKKGNSAKTNRLHFKITLSYVNAKTAHDPLRRRNNAVENAENLEGRVCFSQVWIAALSISLAEWTSRASHTDETLKPLPPSPYKAELPGLRVYQRARWSRKQLPMLAVEISLMRNSHKIRARCNQTLDLIEIIYFTQPPEWGHHSSVH